MNYYQALVRTFMKAVDQNTPTKPTLDQYPYDLRSRLILEEANEFVTAADEHDSVAMIDALCDILYVTYGAANAMGIDLDPFFFEVHRANMDKLGGPMREDGKQLKPEGWKPPDIQRLLNTVIREAQGCDEST